MIEVKNLTKYQGDALVLDGVTFKLNNGVIYGVLDPIGVHKAALLSILAGARKPDGGTVKINGFDTVRERVRALSCIGYLPKEALPYSDMTPEEYLLLVAEAKNVDFELSLRYTQDLIDQLDLRGRKRTLCKNLTFPENRRLCLAQALMGNADILIADDPAYNLNERDARDMIDRVYTAAEGKTLFLGSSSLAVLRAVCDTILLLSEGKLCGIYDPNDPVLSNLYDELCKKNRIATQDSDATTVGIFKKKRGRGRTARPEPLRDGKYELIDDDEK